MTLLDLYKQFGSNKIMRCKQASIDTWEEIEHTINQWQEEEIPLGTALGAIHYDVSTILEIINKDLYDYSFWKEVEEALKNVDIAKTNEER